MTEPDTARTRAFREKHGYSLILEMGDRWSLERIDDELKSAGSIVDPGERISRLADLFVEENTPFFVESDLPPIPDGALRIRFASMDCITFIYYLHALNHARNAEELAERLRSIRYRGTPRADALIHYAWNSASRMCELGMMRNITSELVPKETLRQRTVRLGLLEDGEYFLGKGFGCRGDWNIGCRVTADYIPTASVEGIEPELASGDTVFLVSPKPPSEYPGIVRHALLIRKMGGPEAYVVHCGMSPVGHRDGPRAGVSILTRWDAQAEALYADSVPRRLSRYLQEVWDNAPGIVVFRPTSVDHEV